VHDPQGYSVRVEELNPRAVGMCPRSPRNAESGGPFGYPLGCFPILRLDDHGVLAAQIRLTPGQPVAAPQRDEVVRVEVSQRAAGNRRAIGELADVPQAEQVGIEPCAATQVRDGNCGLDDAAEAGMGCWTHGDTFHVTIDYPLDVRSSTRHPPYVSVRGSSSSVQDGRNSHIDLLSQVLRELRLDSASFRSLLLRGEWRLRFDGPLRGVHIVVVGHPYLALDDGTTRLLGPGDLVVLPRADAHTMSSSADARGPSYSSLKLAESSAEVETIFGEGSPATRIVCGVFFFADEDHPAVVGFPSCIHVPADAHQAPWLAGLTQAVVAEAMERGPGSDVVMARLSDALVTRALRYHLETNEEPGWLHGLRDPAISRALSALHSDLRYPWTVAGLARAAGLSRAGFAARFTALVGQSPMEYVFGCRMRRAETLLRTDHLTVAAVASQVGYGSESALSAAFQRYSGTTPGAYRRLSSAE